MGKGQGDYASGGHTTSNNKTHMNTLDLDFVWLCAKAWTPLVICIIVVIAAIKSTWNR
jgi:hypothetical protein